MRWLGEEEEEGEEGEEESEGEEEEETRKGEKGLKVITLSSRQTDCVGTFTFSSPRGELGTPAKQPGSTDIHRLLRPAAAATIESTAAAATTIAAN